MTQSPTDVKKNDLYVFELPNYVLDSLKLMVFDTSVTEVATEKPAEAHINQSLSEAGNNNSNGCGTCEVEFTSQVSRKSHYKTDHHRFNLKRKLNELPAVSLDEFDVLTENNDLESISGSDTSSDSEDEDDIYEEQKDRLSSILENQVASLQIEDDSGMGPSSHLNTQSPQLYFKSDILPENEIFGAFKALFSKSTIDKPLETIQEWNSKDISSAGAPFSALFMVGGGHFAGAIVSHKRLDTKGNLTKKSETQQERAVQFLEHKTFHRYTTRRKQGGAQSTMDNSKGKANSAGSSLRRYNEAALRLDIQHLLRQWAPYLEKCENIFVRAKSTSDRKIFVDANTCIDKDDPRLRSFPFTTKRPTGHELKRAWCELTYLHVGVKPQATVSKPTAKAPAKEIRKEVKPLVTELGPEERHTKELIALLKKSRAPMLISYIRKHNLNGNFELKPQDEYLQTPTLLHYASQQGLKNMVYILLSNVKCDPTLKNNLGKTAWELTRKKEVQQAFQIARHNLGENYTDWEASRIGDPMSREDVEAINEQEENRIESEKREAIKNELAAARARQEQEKEAKRGPGKTLLPQVSSTQQTMNSLTDSQRMRLMREQRARAAEARMKSNTNK